jgi:hypothetical protein
VGPLPGGRVRLSRARLSPGTPSVVP